MGCPLVFNHYGTTMPQELLAPRYFHARELESTIRRPKELSTLVHQWLTNPPLYFALRHRYQQHRLSADPGTILERLALKQQ